MTLPNPNRHHTIRERSGSGRPSRHATQGPERADGLSDPRNGTSSYIT
jgi:hypothetical protein